MTAISTKKKMSGTYRLKPEVHEMLKRMARFNRKTAGSYMAELITEAAKGIVPDMGNLASKFPAAYDKRKHDYGLKSFTLALTPETKALLVELAHREEKQLSSCLEGLILKAAKKVMSCNEPGGGAV